MIALIRLRALAPVLTLATCTLTTAAHACPSTASGRFAIHTSGDEVTDTHTGLTWRRCSEGQNWNTSTQSCDGTPSNMTHEQAMAHAQAQEGGWRVPSVKELQTLVDRACRNPAIDSNLFPSTAATWYWTSTPRAGVLPGYVWGISFGNGLVGEGLVGDGRRNDSRPVRMVRTSR